MPTTPPTFDGDEDRFAERTGWVKGDDGFLVHDANANGRIDDGSEMFGGRLEGGLAELASYDVNQDGVIDAADAIAKEFGAVVAPAVANDNQEDSSLWSAA